jgi:hypothetical protein
MPTSLMASVLPSSTLAALARLVELIPLNPSGEGQGQNRHVGLENRLSNTLT